MLMAAVGGTQESSKPQTPGSPKCVLALERGHGSAEVEVETDFSSVSFGGREWKPGAAVREEERQRIACMVQTPFPGDELYQSSAALA